MRPPICDLCGLDARDTPGAADGFGLVRFRDHTPLPAGMTGHPKGLLWFCAAHLPAARELRRRSSARALAALRERFGLPG